MVEAQKITFKGKAEDTFYSLLRSRVDAYFTENNISKNANAAMIMKSVFVAVVLVASYILMVFVDFNPWIILGLACLHGFFTALMGMNIAHDAAHGSYSSNQKVNNLLSNTFNIAGTSDYIWKITHNVLHHSFTNIHHHDDDINQVAMLRLKPTQKLWWVHRFQHIYSFILFYPLTTISWVFKDVVKLYKKQIGAYKNKKHPTKEVVKLFFFKLLYFTLYLVLPFIFIDVAWYYIIVGFVALHVVEGLTLAIVFQLAHIVEGAAFPEPDQDGNIDESWSAHQLRTTANFARNSWLAGFICGGLNFQIEHHLFPKVCHIHYKHIAPIVKQTAEEYNLPYLESKTFWGALASHIRLMKMFGRQKDIPELHLH